MVTRQQLYHWAKGKSITDKKIRVGRLPPQNTV
jgi:hypothetical protein